MRHKYQQNTKEIKRVHRKWNSHLVAVLLFAAAFSTMSVYAQMEDSTINNSLKDGAWALQFAVSGNFTLAAFQGASISAKRHFSAHHAIRAGVTLGLSNNESDQSEKTFDNDTLSLLSGGGYSQSNNGQNFEIDVQYLFYVNPAEEINLFVGSGVLVQYSRGYQESSSDPMYPPGFTYAIYRQTTENKKLGLGISGLAGVEWFATKRLSFHAEYRVTVVYESSTNTETRVTIITPPISYGGRTVRELTGKGWRVSSPGVRFGLSVYF